MAISKTKIKELAREQIQQLNAALCLMWLEEPTSEERERRIQHHTKQALFNARKIAG